MTDKSAWSEQMKKAVRAIDTLQVQLAESEARAKRLHEPIAVIGMSCRFPGGSNDPDSFWKLLEEGRSGVIEVPVARWDINAYYDPDPDAAGKIATRYAAFIDGIDRFDADFFGISPREAVSMDPQHRLLLELSWEALENAGRAPRGLAGSRTGVFAGLSSSDYAQLLVARGESSIDAYLGTGTAHSAAVGRVSHVLGLIGPNLAIDTACSSSLVAVHQACRSLLTDECDLALAGGVNALLTPTAMINFSRARMLAPDGRCKTFDADADGYVRGEGGGMIVLKRLSAALRDHDPILALIRGSAVNQDGASSGLTVPNGKAQERVIREALANAGTAPNALSYLEAHGTGTALGDPIELSAAASVFGENREADRQLWIGSVKPNVGHLESAAGIAGVIKVILAIRHSAVPRSLHFRRPNPHLDWSRTPLRIPTATEPWPDGKKIAGVSSFSFSGTNAHVIMEEAPPAEAKPAAGVERSHHVLPLSGRTRGAFEAQVTRYRDWLASHGEAEIADVAFTASVGRSHHEERAAIVIESGAQAQQLLDQLARGESAPGLYRKASRVRPKVAWLFTGQGSQYAGMGRELYDRQPVVRRVLDQCAGLFAAEPRGERGEGLLEVMFSKAALLNRTEYTQPALYALEVALAELWRSWGVEPDVVLGHSVGQYAAAVIAGVMSVEDGLRLIARRGAWMGSLPAGGAMAAVFAERGWVEQGLSGSLTVAADNGAHVVVSGKASELDRLLGKWEAAGVRSQRLNTSHAFHSELLEPMLEELEGEAAKIRFQAAERVLVCNLTGKALAPGQVLDAGYWRRHAREPVEYARSIRTLAERGVGVLLEIGPQPVLLGMAGQCWPAEGVKPAMVASLKRGQREQRAAAEALAQMYVEGVTPDFAAWDRPWPRRKLALPTYPFQRSRYWVSSAESQSGPKTGTVPEYYDALARQGTAERGSPFLTFGPLEKVVPGFSWVQAMALPDRYPEQAALLLRAQQEMREALFHHVRFDQVASVLDVGCGLGSDLIVLAESHPKLKLQGYTISAEQVGVARRRAAEHNVESRIEFFHRDSAEVEFPSRYQLAFGFEVVHHVKAKARLFSNIERHLEDNGLLVLADFLSGMDMPIEHQLTSSFISTIEQWCQLLSPHGLRLVEAIDISPEIANFLHDPEFERHCQEVQDAGHAADANILSAARSYDQMGKAIERGLARYVLLTARKDAGAAWSEIDRENRAKLGNLTPYRRWRGRDIAYRLEWRKSLPPAAAETRQDGYWVVLAPAGAFPGEIETRLPGSSIWISPDENDLASRLESIARTSGDPAKCRGVLHACSGFESSRTALNLVKALESLPAWNVVPVWLITRGVHAIGSGSDPVNCADAPLWGLGRVVALERPYASCARVDLSGGDLTSAELNQFAAELSNPSGEPEIAFRGDQRYIARLAALDTPSDTESAPVRPDRTYLITGGLGSLGIFSAEWLAGQGARSIVLIGRGAPGPDVMEEIRRIESSGCGIRALQADVSDAGQLQAALASVRSSMPPLGGVIHAAGVVDDGILLQQTWERFEKIFAPKVIGAWLLHQHTLDDPLDFFILYSSATAVLGAPGQSGYAAANAFLDALAHYRRQLNLPALAIDWGLWADSHMAKDSPQAARAFESQGGLLLQRTEAFRALGHLLAERESQALLTRVDWQRFATQSTMRSSPILEELIPKRASRSATPPFVERLRQVEPAERLQLLRNQVETLVMQVLERDSPPDPHTGFFDLGMDSLMALELRNLLQKDLLTGAPQPATIAFDYPSVDRLAEYIADQIGEVSRVMPKVNAVSHTATEPIAIVGMACRFPGAEDLPSFWRLLEKGEDAVVPAPGDRWNADAYYDPDPDASGKMYTREAGFLRQVDRFDASFFGISPREATSLDPQHRLLLEVSWEALENAGIAAPRLTDTRTGVFMGISTGDYAYLLAAAEAADVDVYFATGTAHSTGVGRISHFLGLQGPNQAIDTACSSSLVALSQACDSLNSGRSSLALAGGVNVILSPGGMINLSRMRMLSRSGRCRAFDAAADGYIRGEGCGVLVLKRLSEAERDRDHIWAVIRGSAVNHDGSTSGLTVPNGPAQERVIREALEQAGIPPAAVDYLEGHGTGTSLGDPIEVHAASNIFGVGRDPGHPLLLGSVKTNIGHLEAAAGVASLMKVALSLGAPTIPKHLHLSSPNPHIDWDRIPVRVASEPVSWPKQRRIAGVSSFGFSGTNAHVILEAAPPQSKDDARNPGPYVLPLSGKTSAALLELAGRYTAWFGENPDADLADVCFTASTGRAHFEYRSALVAASISDVLGLLAALKSHRSAVGLFVGHVERSNHRVSSSLSEAIKPEDLAQLYVSGAAPDFASWYAASKFRKVVLPTYPFQRERYWVEGSASAPAMVAKPVERHSMAAQPEVPDDMEAYISHAVREALALPGLPDARQDFIELGMDSLVATQLTTKIQSRFEISLTSTVFLDYRNVTDLAAYIARQLAAGLPRPKTIAAAAASAPPGLAFWQSRVMAKSASEATVSAPRTTPAVGPAPIPIWPDQESVSLRIYRPSTKATGTAILVCPGGGYGTLAMDTEGHQVAKWLNSIGVTAAVLAYRIAPQDRYPAPFDDARRAMRYVRKHAASLGIADGRIGAMGFSAGGHLAALLGTHFDGGAPEAADALERLSCRPDFLVLGYPVISMIESVNVVTRRNLLGDDPDPAILQWLSVERHVHANVPPTFIFHTGEDKAVLVDHSIRFYEALRHAEVPAELHIFQFGPHGAGLAEGDPVLASWKQRLHDWLIASCLLTEAERAAVEGEVIVGGTPVAFGAVTFRSTENDVHPVAWGQIHLGRYSIPASRGPVVGGANVQIRVMGSVGLEPTLDEAYVAGEIAVHVAGGDNRLSFHL